MSPSETPVAIAFGANLHEPAAAIARAAARLRRQAVPDLRLAPLYETAPVDCAPGTPRFLNTAGIGKTTLEPRELLAACKQIEIEMGRPANHDSDAARPIDLDLILWGEACVRMPGLVIPHPRFAERLFVLAPLADIAPDWRVPTIGRTVGELAAGLLATADPAWGRRLEPPWRGPA